MHSFLDISKTQIPAMCKVYDEAINWGRICFDVCLVSIISAWCVDDVQIFGLYRYTIEWLFIHKMHRNPQIANVFDIIAKLNDVH